MPTTTTPGDLLGACFGGTTLVGSLVIMGLSASIVAHDHNSSIGITHLVVSLISLLFVVCAFVAICSTEPGQDRADTAQGCSFIIILITMFMYLGSLIALAVVPTSRADYLAGQRDNNSTSLTDHPYYGIFVFDIIIV